MKFVRTLVFLMLSTRLTLADEVNAVGSLGVTLSADSETLVVVDASRSRLALYRRSGNNVWLVDVLDVGADLAKGPVKREPDPATAIPAKDAPGQDPPEFVRPPKAVRSRSRYESEHTGRQTWQASYYVPGTVDEVFVGVRSAHKDWTVLTESVSMPQQNEQPSAYLEIRKDDVKLNLSVDVQFTPRGWVRVSASETKSRD